MMQPCTTSISEGASSSLLAHAKGRLFINCATVNPDVHIATEQVVERYEGASLEACMASSITQARQGTLYLMCAGKESVFERARPLLEVVVAHLRYIGRTGEAAKVKALVNMVMNCNTAALAEGLGLGAALGVDLTMLREVFSQTGAAFLASWKLTAKTCRPEPTTAIFLLPMPLRIPALRLDSQRP